MNTDTAPRSDSTPLALQAAQRLLAGTDAEFIHSMDVTDDRGTGVSNAGRCARRPATTRLFPGAQQVFRLRRAPSASMVSAPVRKSSTASLAPTGASPQDLNAYARGQWSLESRVLTRDVTFHEDNSQLRTGTAPRAAASFRNLSLNTSASPDAQTSPTPARATRPCRRLRRRHPTT